MPYVRKAPKLFFEQPYRECTKSDVLGLHGMVPKQFIHGTIGNMEHLDAIDAGLKAGRSHNEIAREVFLTYPTKAFIGKEDRQFRILNEVAERFHVTISCIHAAGSAKLGVSLHKGSEFTAGKSDLDLAIIDSTLFSKYLEFGLKLSKGYSDGTAFPIIRGASTQPEYQAYLARGIFRPDLMPRGTQRADWNNFFGRLSADHLDLFSSITGAVYLSQSCFESKQRSVIRTRARKEAL